MLVLTRRIGDGILIDSNIAIKVLGVKGRTIRLGVTAPPEVKILRQEVHERDDIFRDVESTHRQKEEQLICAD